MALPKLNESVRYEIQIPSTMKVVTYRPYLVKEEKILLQAHESNDEKTAMRAMLDTVVACIYDNVDIDSLTSFDVEYLFTMIRAKSVGETSTLNGVCSAKDCDGKTDVTIELSSIDIPTPPKDISNIVEINPEISIELRYPSYNAFMSNFSDGMSESDYGLGMINHCILAILTPNERITEWSQKEMNEFIDSMTSVQFEKLGGFLGTIPSLKQEVEFTCKKCGHENKLTLEGLQDFF